MLLTEFLSSNIGWTVNLILTWVMFWVYGFPVWRDYGYSDKLNPEGGFDSGPNGSGVAVISLGLIVSCTAIWTSQLLAFKPEQKEESNVD